MKNDLQSRSNTKTELSPKLICDKLMVTRSHIEIKCTSGDKFDYAVSFQQDRRKHFFLLSDLLIQTRIRSRQHLANYQFISIFEI